METDSFFAALGDMFLSLTWQEGPPPGAYEVQKSFERSQGKSEYMPPRTTVAKRKHASFLSTTSRQGLMATERGLPGTFLKKFFK